MSYTHLTIEERSKIEILHQEGYKPSKIAKILNRHRSSIYRELKRCETSVYSAIEADNAAQCNSQNKGRKPKYTAVLINDIKQKLEQTWSPEQIVGRDYKGKLSFKTIYNWIYKGFINVSLKVLRQKGKRRLPKETRGKFNIGTSISLRPQSVKSRKEFGHWELDTVVSSRGKSKGCVATFAERKSRFYVALLMPDRSKEAMKIAIKQLTNTLPQAAFKTFTSDRGKEFACYADVEEQGVDFYFADSYSAWQRGTNENSNGLLREFFPKKTDFSKVKPKELLEALLTINNRPRKCLGYKTPFEVLLHELNFIDS